MIAINRYDCISISLNQKPDICTSNFFMHVAVARSFAGDVAVCASGLVDDFMFSCNGRGIYVTQTVHMLKVPCQGSAPVAQSDVCDCLVTILCWQ